MGKRCAIWPRRSFNVQSVGILIWIKLPCFAATKLQLEFRIPSGRRGPWGDEVTFQSRRATIEERIRLTTEKYTQG